MIWALLIFIMGPDGAQPLNGRDSPFGMFPNAAHCRMAGEALTARAPHLTWRCEAPV